jgi:hypothetical protein
MMPDLYEYCSTCHQDKRFKDPKRRKALEDEVKRKRHPAMTSSTPHQLIFWIDNRNTMQPVIPYPKEKRRKEVHQ